MTHHIGSISTELEAGLAEGHEVMKALILGINSRM